MSATYKRRTIQYMFGDCEKSAKSTVSDNDSWKGMRRYPKRWRCVDVLKDK